MHQRASTIVFLILLLLACLGAYLLGRMLPPVAQVDQARPDAGTPLGSATRAPATAQAMATSTRTTALRPGPAIATPARPAPATPASPQPVADAAPPTATPDAGPTPTATSTPTAEFPDDGFGFALLTPVRHSSGNCPGNYILGQVRDRSGNLLPNVSLLLSDEYGNQQRQMTKAGAGEVGRYDFPLFGPPRRFYLSVVDAVGRPLSPTIEIPHGIGAFAQASCHWADWQQR